MNTLQQSLFSLVSGYVVSEMFKLPYQDCVYVACISAAGPLIWWLLNRIKTKSTKSNKNT